MGELEHTLSELMASPEAMEQLQSMARSLGLGDMAVPGPSPGPLPEQDRTMPDTPPLPELDPRMLGLLTQLMREYHRPDDQKTALLEALRPFLRPERAANIDRALRMARLSRVLNTALGAARGGGEAV